jgi:hypothetical protein
MCLATDKRVESWRESGLTSEQYSDGRGFSASGLRHWAYKLGRTERPRPTVEVPDVRIVRVVRATAGAGSEGGYANGTTSVGFDDNTGRCGEAIELAVRTNAEEVVPLKAPRGQMATGRHGETVPDRVSPTAKLERRVVGHGRIRGELRGQNKRIDLKRVPAVSPKLDRENRPELPRLSGWDGPTLQM